MPLVSAESVPRPEAPAPVSVQAPSDYQSIPSDVSEFGALQAHSMSELGKAAQEAGGAGFDIAIMRQRLHNDVVSDNQINNYNDQLTQKETAFYALHGQDAVDAYPAFRDDLINSRNELRSQLQNPMQQLEFDRQTRRMQALTLGRAGIHYDQQYDVFQTGVNKAGATLADQSMASHFDDPVAFDEAIRDKMNYRYQELQREGRDRNPVAVAAMQGEVRSDAVKTQIEGYIGRNNTQAAANILNAESGPNGALSAADAARYRTVLSDANVSSAVDRAMGRGGTAPGVPGRGGAAVQGGGQNNPGNIRVPGSTGKDPGAFQSFPTPEAGVAAIKDNLLNYQDQHGLNTVSGIISRWAPSNENLTPRLIQNASDRTGFAPDQKIDLHDPATMEKMINAIVAQEGKGGVSPDVVKRVASGATAPAGLRGAPPIIDETKQAGFGTRFGPLQPVQGMIIHHTAGGESVDDVIKTFKQTGYPAQFVIDRQGKIYQTLPDGYQGRHILNSYGPLGAGKTNANMEGVEIIANNDGDVLPVQEEAAAKLVAMRAQKFGYNPQTSVFGHGEVNPGHKEADEGMSTVTRIRNGSLDVSPPAVQMAAAAPITTTDVPPGAPAPTGTAPTGAAPGAPSPGAAPMIPTVPATAGQAQLATGKPDYAAAIARINADPSLNPDERKRALGMLGEQMRIEHEAATYPDQDAERKLKLWQTGNEADLYAKAITGQDMDQAGLAWMVKNQEITPAGYNALMAERGRTDRGTDDVPTVMDLTRRAAAGEDVTADIYAARQAGKVKGTTADTLLKTTETRQRTVADEVERRDFATLRTIAGMDAADHPMVDFGKEANAAQTSLWGQAQLEWNRRVLVGRENPDAVLADMGPRYGKPVVDVRALPNPRVGARPEKAADVPALALATEDAHNRGTLSDAQYQQEKDLLIKYNKALADQEQRKAAADAARAKTAGQSRGRVSTPQ